MWEHPTNQLTLPDVDTADYDGVGANLDIRVPKPEPQPSKLCNNIQPNMAYSISYIAMPKAIPFHKPPLVCLLYQFIPSFTTLLDLMTNEYFVRHL